MLVLTGVIQLTDRVASSSTVMVLGSRQIRD
jgi:hypothetical protein